MKSTFLTIAAAALLITPSLLAQDAPAPGGPGGNRPGGPGGAGRFGGTPEERVKRLTEQLGLSAEQAEKIKAIYTKAADELKPIREKGRDMTAEDRTKMQEINKKQTDDVAAVLTEEQKKKQAELRPNRGGGAGGAGGAGGGRRGGNGGAGGAAPAPGN